MLTFTHTHTLEYGQMTPSVIIAVRGETVATVKLSEKDTFHVLKALGEYSLKNLIDPETREPYPKNKEDHEKNMELGKAICEGKKKDRN